MQHELPIYRMQEELLGTDVPAGNIHGPAHEPSQTGVNFYEDPALDAIVDALFEASAQAWVARRRLAALEAVLVDRGVLTAGELDRFTFDSETEDQLSGLRQEFVNRIGAAFMRYSG